MLHLLANILIVTFELSHRTYSCRDILLKTENDSLMVSLQEKLPNQGIHPLGNMNVYQSNA